MCSIGPFLYLSENNHGGSLLHTRLTSPFSKGETGLGTLATFFPPHSCPSHELRGSVDVKASHSNVITTPPFGRLQGSGSKCLSTQPPLQGSGIGSSQLAACGVAAAGGQRPRRGCEESCRGTEEGAAAQGGLAGSLAGTGAEKML